MKGLKFILVDDNNTYREALKTILIGQYDAIILAEASNAEETLKIDCLNQADIILMDVMMPVVSGIELAKELLWFHNSKLKIIAITMHVDEVYMTSLIETGFRGCIFKNDLVKQLNNALTSVSKGDSYFPENILFDYNSRLNNK